MTLWSRFRSWLRATVGRSRMESEMDAELRFHMETYAEDLVRDGVQREEAMRRARLEFGGIERVKEEGREARGVSLIESLVQDLRYAASSMLRTPCLTAITAFTLALGIGATTAIFSAVNPILFESLPYPDAGRIMMISDFGREGSRLDVTFHTYRELSERSRSFEAMAVMKPWQPTITSATQPERLEGQRVSAGYLHALGVSPELGRDFDASDDRLNGSKVVILSGAFLQRRFGGDRAIVGRQITLDDNLYTVIGVMPSAFKNVLAPTAELWTPLQYDGRNIISFQSREWGHHLRMLGRVRPGIQQGTSQAGTRKHCAQPGAGVPEATVGVSRAGVDREFAAARPNGGREAGAACRTCRSYARAPDCLRERDELAAGAWRTAAG